jgi:hypothetical protein
VLAPVAAGLRLNRNAWHGEIALPIAAPAPIKPGTDGWRAVIAEDFHFANVARVAQAAADLKV